MQEPEAAQGRGERLDAAMEKVLADPVFARSPTLCRLLRYLVQRTQSGDAASLKSYTVALDGLGRDPDAGSPDAYARVQVGRLRKALAAHYAAKAEAGDPACDRLRMEPGSYFVLLDNADDDGQAGAGHAAAADGTKAAGVASRETAGAGQATNGTRLSMRGRRVWPVAAVLGIALGLVIAVWFVQRGRTAREVWRNPDFPTVAVVLDEYSGARDDRFEQQRLRFGLMRSLGQYDSVRPMMKRSGAQFTLHVMDAPQVAGESIQLALAENASGRVIWTRAWPDQDDDPAATARMQQEAAFEIGHATGVLSTWKRQQGPLPWSPYGCWLRYAEAIQTVEALRNRTIGKCARDWQRNASGHPIGTALWVWSATSEAAFAESDSARAKTLAEAIETANRAELLNPRSALLRVAAMRAYAYAGEREQMIERGRQALALSGDNADIKGQVGLYFALADVPGSRQLIAEARDANPEPTPWYQMGMAVDAMMRDDLAAMRASLDGLEEVDTGDQITIELLHAAYEARTGKAEAARARLARFNAGPGDAAARMARMMSWLPLAPAVRRHFLDWLAPVQAA